MSDEKKPMSKKIKVTLVVLITLTLLLVGYVMRDDLLMKIRSDYATMSKDPSMSALKPTKENSISY